MDAMLERFDRIILMALEHLEHVRGTHFEGYAEEVVERLVCRRELYARHLSLLN